jgi:predicted nucleic acid-binding protein
MRRVYLDTCIVIYLIENTGMHSERSRDFLAANSDALLCVSPLVKMEAIVKPLRESAAELVADYEEFLANQQWLSINDDIVNHATSIRAAHNLKTPDALHLAIAQKHGCNELWTNDNRLGKIAAGMAVNIFGDTK